MILAALAGRFKSIIFASTHHFRCFRKGELVNSIILSQQHHFNKQIIPTASFCLNASFWLKAPFSYSTSIKKVWDVPKIKSHRYAERPHPRIKKETPQPPSPPPPAPGARGWRISHHQCFCVNRHMIQSHDRGFCCSFASISVRRQRCCITSACATPSSTPGRRRLLHRRHHQYRCRPLSHPQHRCHSRVHLRRYQDTQR